MTDSTTVAPAAGAVEPAAPAAAPAPSKLQQTSALVSRINKLLSTRAGFDRTCSLLYYLLTFLSPQLNRLSVISASLPLLSTRTRTLASLISDIRMFLRLPGLLGMFSWGYSTYTSPPSDPVEKYITYAQVAVNTVYQILENAAYLSMKKVVTLPGKGRGSEGWCWIWSTRCWLAHCGLEFARLEVERRRMKGTRKVGEKVETEEAEIRRNWWKAVVGNAAYTPLAAHWSTETGLISDTWVGACGSIASVIGFRDAWRATA